MKKINKNILILVKTYPNLSCKYGEIVCTAGIDEEGKWYRIYPIPFRMLQNDSKYKKFQWINCDIWETKDDPRKESYKIDYDNIKIHGNKYIKDWADRLKIIEKTKIENNLENLIAENKKLKLSLATFKPTKVLDVIIKPIDRDYKEEKIRTISAKNSQHDFFKDTTAVNVLELMPKLPYKFSYKFQDIQGKESTLMIEDWEIGQLYLNCFKDSNNEKIACEKVKEKYLKLAKEKNIYFFLGTTKQYDSWAVNPFIITGVFYPPKQVNDSFGF